MIALDANNAGTQSTSINIPTLAAVVTAFIDNYDHLTLPTIVNLLASDRIALIAALSPLIHATESMDKNEKQYWFDIFPSMTENQIGRLLEILGTERRKLMQLELKYQAEIRALNEKHLIEWDSFQNNNAPAISQDNPEIAAE